MSWLEKVKNGLTITCGDGKEYTPNYLNATKSVAYNVAEFNFPNIDGTLVERKAAQGRKFPIEIYFQGEENLDTAAAFERSANDSRSWTLSHPYYGDIIVQPVSLVFDNSEHNVSKITGTVLETIEKIRPDVSVAPIEAIVEAKAVADAALGDAYVNAEPPTASGLADFLGKVQGAYEQGKQYAGEAGSYYDNAMRTAQSAITASQAAIGSGFTAVATALRATSDAIQFVQSFPADFVSNIEGRFTAMQAQFSRLTEVLVPASMNNEDKEQYALQAGTLISTMAVSTVQQVEVDAEGNFNTVEQTYASAGVALQAIDFLLENYNTFAATMDLLQTENGGSPESYVPSFATMQALENVVNLTAANLFNIALNSQQERTVILRYDSNPIELTHRFYGLDNADENLARLIRTNNFGLNEYLLVRANTPIVFYV